MSSMQFSPKVSQRSSLAIEHFRTFPASLGSPPTESRLERSRRFGIFRPKPDIATGLSSSGWLATASTSEVRVYRLDNVDQTHAIQQEAWARCSPEGDIRGLSISHDLLAIITSDRLLIWEYREPGAFDRAPFENKTVCRNGEWTPSAVAIHQYGTVGQGLESSAWLAIGGHGKNCVRLLMYSHNTCWNAHSDRVVLSCAGNTTSMRLVDFSPILPNTNECIVFAVTETNKIYGWNVRHKVLESRPLEPSWHLNCNGRGNDALHRGGVTSATIFLSPSKRPYIFCSIEQKPGSQILRTFVAPVEKTYPNKGIDIAQCRELPEEAVGRSVLYGTVTSNGQFLVVVEDGKMQLLTLSGSYKGGLTCRTPDTKEWPSSLKPAAIDVSAISLSVKECRGRLEIVAVDGLGHILFARISVPDMPEPETPRMERPLPLELYHESIVELSPELSGESSRGSGSTMERID